MNDIRPTFGIEFDDKYLEAKSKLLAFIDALTYLTPEQNYHLAMELMEATGFADILEQFLNNLNNGKK